LCEALLVMRIERQAKIPGRSNAPAAPGADIVAYLISCAFAAFATGTSRTGAIFLHLIAPNISERPRFLPAPLADPDAEN